MFVVDSNDYKAVAVSSKTITTVSQISDMMWFLKAFISVFGLKFNEHNASVVIFTVITFLFDC